MQMPRHGMCRWFHICTYDLLTITNPVVLGDQRVLIRIHTGRNTLQSGTLNVVSQGSQINYALEAAKVLGDGVYISSKHDIVGDLAKRLQYRQICKGKGQYRVPSG
jgi:hypothetical protein